MRKVTLARIAFIFSVLQLAIGVIEGDVLPPQTGLSTTKLTIVTDQNRPLVFFPEALPVELEIISSTSDPQPVKVTGTFDSALGVFGETQSHRSRWHRRHGSVYLDEYGDYYFRTATDGVKILLLSPKQDVLQNLIAFFDWYCRNSQIGPADVGVFGLPILRKLFYSTQYPNYNCGESMTAFNTYAASLFGLRTRQANYFGLIEADRGFWGHTVSEIEVDGRRVFFDSLFNVMAESDGRYLSLFDTLTRMHNGQPFAFRHVVAKDVFLGPGTSPNKYDYTHWYAPERVQHINIGRFLTPQMRAGLDYCYINTYYGFDPSGYVALEEFHDLFY